MAVQGLGLNTSTAEWLESTTCIQPLVRELRSWKPSREARKKKKKKNWILSLDTEKFEPILVNNE